MDVRYINPFIAAIKNVFSTMVHTEVTVGKPCVHLQEIRSADVSGVIGLSGDVTGAVVLSFPRVVACKAASLFAGVNMTPEHADFADAIGELANMIAGNAKKDFAGLNVSISLPSVVLGAGHQVAPNRTSPQLTVPCQTPMGPFNVDVAMVVGKPFPQRNAPALVGAPA